MKSPTRLTPGRRRSAVATVLSPTREICSTLTRSTTTGWSMRSWMTSVAARFWRAVTTISSMPPAVETSTEVSSLSGDSISWATSSWAIATVSWVSAAAADIAINIRTAFLSSTLIFDLLRGTLRTARPTRGASTGPVNSGPGDYSNQRAWPRLPARRP